MKEITVSLERHVALVEMHRPPHNHFDRALIEQLADALEALDRNDDCRAVVLASEGRSFCAGADFRTHGEVSGDNSLALRVDAIYEQALRLFACQKPLVAAVQGAAVGGGLGLALVADFRVVSARSKFIANFVRLGIHPGFGLTHTLPRLIGPQQAQRMFLTGCMVKGAEAVQIGLADRLAPEPDLRGEALQLAADIAANAPLAVVSTRATLRRGLVEAVRAHTEHEFTEQARLFRTADHAEGVRAFREQRPGDFQGR